MGDDLVTGVKASSLPILSALADGPISATFAATDSNANPESASASTTLDTDASEHVTLSLAPVVNAAAAPSAAFTLAGLTPAEHTPHLLSPDHLPALLPLDKTTH